MAYPTVSGPYGLKPVNLIGGRVFAGSTRMFPIVNGYSTSLFNGDVVALGTSANIGALVSSTLAYNGASAVNGTIGVFAGCEYSTTGGPIYGKNRYQFWQASTTATPLAPLYKRGGSNEHSHFCFCPSRTCSA